MIHPLRPLRWLAAAACTISVLAAPAWSQPAPPSRPNVVIIVADDLGYADIGAQGISDDVKTPHIDSIATGGVRLTNGYVSAPVCSPSRAGFLTGRYQQRFGHEANPIPAYDGTFGLPLDQVTLADELRRAGYATGMTGKWHLGGQPEFQPNKRGFQEFYGFLGGAHSYTRKGIGNNVLRRNDAPVDEKEYLTDAITREAVSFIERHKHGPFILYVPYNAVHTPQEAPSEYQQQFAHVKDPHRRLLLAMLAAQDAGVGRILAELRQAGLEENTLVIFFSDNGGPTRGNASRNAPLRGFKGQLWEGGIRIPFLMRWTGHIPAGRLLDQPVTTLDLVPTALAAAGIEPRKELKLDGVNLLPWLSGTRHDRPHDVLYWRIKPQWAVRERDFKLVAALGEVGPKLFDLSKDPGETTDVLAERPEVARRLRQKFEAWNAQLMEPRWPGKQEGAHQDGTPAPAEP